MHQLVDFIYRSSRTIQHSRETGYTGSRGRADDQTTHCPVDVRKGRLPDRLMSIMHRGTEIAMLDVNSPTQVPLGKAESARNTNRNRFREKHKPIVHDGSSPISIPWTLTES